MSYTKTSLVVPGPCIADFSLIPHKIGSQNTSYSKIVADIQLLVQKSGLKFKMHATGTVIEGPWNQVTELIGFAHTLVHQSGIKRVQTDVRISTRTDKPEQIDGNISSVEKCLSSE